MLVNRPKKGFKYAASCTCNTAQQDLVLSEVINPVEFKGVLKDFDKTPSVKTFLFHLFGGLFGN